jgi:hypothetical protein
MAQYGPNDVIIEVDVSVGGALGVLTPYVLEINGIKRTALLQERTPFGQTWLQFLFTGMKSLDKISMLLLYDDAAVPAPDAMFTAKEGEQRTFKITYGGTKTTSVETLIESSERIAKVKEKTLMRVELQPTGTVTEA